MDMDTTEATTTEVEIWVLVDADGNAVADCLSEHLKDEYEADHGQELDPATPTRLVRVVITVPLPRAVEMRGAVAVEVAAGTGLKAA